jgi:hypothetical protein
MKKIIALVLALTMAFSMALSVSAANVSYNGGSTFDNGYTAEGVNIVITMSGLNVVHTYAFDIEYGSMEFTYGKVMTWNPETYKYEASSEGSDWHAADNANKIKVINHSDMPIYCSAEATVDEDADGEFTLTVTGKDKEIAGCDIDTVPSSLFAEMFVELSGVPHISSGDKIRIGQVVVTVSKPAANAQ